MEHIGIERALGTVFYVDGGLSQQLYERYIARVNIFKANYRLVHKAESRENFIYNS